MTQKTKLSSIIQTVLVLGVEMGLDMASQNIDINVAWVQDELWKERRELIVKDALKRIERLSCVRDAMCAEQPSDITALSTECEAILNSIAKRT